MDAGRKFRIGLKSDPERNVAQYFVVWNAAAIPLKYETRRILLIKQFHARIGKIRPFGQGEHVLLQIIKEILVAHGRFLFNFQGRLLVALAFSAAWDAGNAPCFLASVPAFIATVGATASALGASC